MVKLHLHVGHMAGVLPRATRLRKRRDRKLRPVRPSHRNEIWYRSELDAIVEQLRRAGADVSAAIEPHWPKQPEATDARRGRDKERTTEPPGGEAIDAAQAGFRNIRGVAAEITIGTHGKTGVVQRNLDAVDDRLSASVKRSVGIDIRAVLTNHGPIADEMAKATQANIDLITSIPDQYFDRLRDEITDAWQNGEYFDGLADRIQHIGDVTESRAELIARDQTSKLNSAFNRVRQTSVGIERYTWQTAEDERVRESHADLDGQEFSWDDPPTVDDEVAHPGEPINCRCIANPVLDLENDAAAGAGALTGEEDDDEIAEAA